MVTIDTLLSDPPPNVDLTMVGGQALVYWTLVYQTRYSKLFPDEVISSTTDVGFVVQLKEACQKCHDYWGGKLYSPGWNATPEYGYLVIGDEDGDAGTLRVDLMKYIFRLDKHEIRKHRVLVGQDDRYKDMYVLTELRTLLNRVYNAVSLPKYERPEVWCSCATH